MALSRAHTGTAGAMATVVPTAAQVRKQAFGRPKIVEALQLLGVDAHHKMGAKALKAQPGGERRAVGRLRRAKIMKEELEEALRSQG